MATNLEIKVIRESYEKLYIIHWKFRLKEQISRNVQTIQMMIEKNRISQQTHNR